MGCVCEGAGGEERAKVVGLPRGRIRLGTW